MRQLADFVDRMIGRAGANGRPRREAASQTNGARPRSGRAIGVIGIPGDRRDDDQREYGAVAATAFDEIIVREDKNLRGRAARRDGGQRGRRDQGGAGAGGRARTVRAEKVLDEMAAVRAALRRAAPGDLVVMCVDDAVGVYRAAMAASRGQAGPTAFTDPGELEAPEG